MTHRRIYSFAPIEPPRARLLILGSMPGEASLRAGEYYAHPRNAFWPILGACLGFDPALPYAQRTEALQSAGIALWDVLHSCRRRGSLDSDIDPRSHAVNDFRRFFRKHTGIFAILFNGTTAESCFRRYVPPEWLPSKLILRRMPSTSPAMASLSPENKLALWRGTFAEFLPPT